MTFWHTSIDGSWKFLINKQGFRSDYDYKYERTSEKTRILVLGDSHTLGFEVRQECTYSAVIEKSLNRHGLRAEVFNMGVAGFSTSEELLFLENEGIKYNPDIVILGFYANDLEDNVKSDIFSLINNELTLNKKEYLPGINYLDFIYSIPFASWLSQHSYIFSFSLNTIWEASKRHLAKSKIHALSIEYAIPVSEIDNYQLLLQEKLLERMHSFCKKKHYLFIILNIPPNKGQKAIQSSLASEKHADIYYDGNEILSVNPSQNDIFLPHGQHHISEYTHNYIGEKMAKIIIENRVNLQNE